MTRGARSQRSLKRPSDAMEPFDLAFDRLVVLVARKVVCLEMADKAEGAEEMTLRLYAQHLDRMMAELKANLAVDEEAVSAWLGTLNDRAKHGEPARALAVELLAMDFLQGGD